MHTTSMLLVASATVLALVAGRTSAATSTSTLSSTRAHATVFEPLLTSLNADCHTITAENACLTAHCAWCKAGAVPSACYTADEAAQLPPAVFQCDTQQQQQQQQQFDDNNNNEQQEINWELTTAPATDEHVTSLFRAWQQQFDKRYVSAQETATRRVIFAANARDVAVHNAQRRKTFTMALNAFADLTWDEFQASYLLTTPQNCSATSTTTLQTTTTTPDTKDWRNDGAVSPVKNQGKCGSCWTFSTTGCLESHWQLAHHEMILLSEQQLLDCAGAFDNHGCNGGLPSHAFEYIHYAGGLNTAATYPYVAAVGKCKFNAYHIGATVAQVVNITARDEQHLHVAVGTIGPVSIAFQVVSDFRFYKSGVYSSTDCKAGEQDVNHAVLAVGYGTRDEHTQQRAGAISQEDDVASSSNTTPYWIVKNSWGSAWGMDGFFEIARGTNMCGVATCASYPVVG